MDFINKYSTFCKWFYIIILGLAIPFYLLLYGASGHKFNPPTEDIVGMTVIFMAFGVAIIYLTLRERSGPGFVIIQTLFSITLLMTALGGLKLFLYVLEFDDEDDISFIMWGLFYLIPLLFTFSSIVILLGLYIKKVE